MNQHAVKNIAFFIPTLTSGGGERVVSTLSLHFAKRVSCSLIVFEKNISYPFSGEIISLDVPLSQNPLRRAWRFWVRLFRFYRTISSGRFDVIISVGNAPNFINLLVNRSKAVVRVDLPPSFSTPGFWGWGYRMAGKLLFLRAKRIVAVSRFIQHDLQEHFGVLAQNITMIPNPVEGKSILRLAKEPIPVSLKRVFEGKVVITMGRMTHQKGQWHLLRAFGAVKEMVPDAHLIVLGEGELQGKLEELVHALQLDSSVDFLGWQQNPFAFLAKARLFVLPSLWEGLPDALLEAMVCGLPTMSCDCRSGPREILAPSTDPVFETKIVEQGEYGLLVPVCDGKWRKGKESLALQEHMMAEAIVRVLKDEDLQEKLAKKSKERALQYDITTVIPQWEFLWRK